ncbi:guanine deaminase [Echinimonas agarilytica]|uniref:Guanine deaminase n=1 Tax=Echinimonas agarilytica TaxID=1215918 RepID=A0AA41W8T4_9GAMM|nr:guanine deaminase [Echinimonas agarilytica]MCM2680219.1 guanine deaminase [Echinimonas agarilytica]
MTSNCKAFRARILHFTDIPDPSAGQGFEYYDDGVLVIEQGLVKQLDSAKNMAAGGFDLSQCEHFPDHLLMPGFIDSHIHSPQTDVIVSYGEQLLDWLNKFTFPNELKFSCREFASQKAEEFIDILLENGTTSAMVFTSVFAQSTDAFFDVANKRNMRMMAGKVMMDRNAPEGLLDTPKQSETECRALIEKWHKVGRMRYALTPRFAPTSSPEQLAVAGQLYRDYPGLYLQTHLSENIQEVAWIKELFPSAKDYLDVYDHYGLLGTRSVFAHGIHLNDREVQRLADTGSGIAFCPTSNLFIGSGLLNMQRLEDAGIPISMATDVGGGTSFSLLRTLAEAYKILQVQQQTLHPLKGLYMATLGNARSLMLDGYIGNFETHKEADFVLLNLTPNRLQRARQAVANSLEDTLFALMMLGDEMNVDRTYIMGKLAYQRHNSEQGE